MPQGSCGRIEWGSHFLGQYKSGSAGTNQIQWQTDAGYLTSEIGYASVNEGSFASTVDEPGGVLAVTTDTGDDDNFVMYAGTFKPADGGMWTEARFKTNSATLGAIYFGFTETLALDTPVMPAEFATATMTHNGTGGMAGIQFDTDGTTKDFRAVFGDGGAALARVDKNGQALTAAGSVANATITADRWYIARVEVKPNGLARVYFGDADASKGLTLVAESTAALGTSDLFYACLMFENRSGAARLFEVDYFKGAANVDWAPD
jgi:hypothetical protein